MGLSPCSECLRLGPLRLWGQGAVNEGLPSPDRTQWTDLNLIPVQPGMVLSQVHHEMGKIRAALSISIKMQTILFGKACFIFIVFLFCFVFLFFMKHFWLNWLSFTKGIARRSELLLWGIL